jgi:hypothetical protein
MNPREHSNDEANAKAIEKLGWVIESSGDGYFRAAQGGFKTKWYDSLTAVAEHVKLLSK